MNENYSNINPLIERNKMREYPPIIRINGEEYTLVKTREYVPVAIYKNDSTYLRIGPEDIIAPELELHKKLLNYGFPVPFIKPIGQHENNSYYSEEVLGEKTLAEEFREDCKNEGVISPEHFNNLIEVSTKVAEAQLKTASEDKDYESFYIGIHMDYIVDELPEFKSEIEAAFEKLKERTNNLPNVLTHGDFNPYNLFKRGIIDFGSMHNAPAGYDIVNNIYNTYGFPKSGDYENMRRYEFTKEQQEQYFEVMDSIYTTAGLPKVTNLKDDFIWAKSVWGTSRMQNYPKLQEWRYKRFKKMTSEYLNNQDLLATALEF